MPWISGKSKICMGNHLGFSRVFCAVSLFRRLSLPSLDSKLSAESYKLFKFDNRNLDVALYGRLVLDDATELCTYP